MTPPNADLMPFSPRCRRVIDLRQNVSSDSVPSVRDDEILTAARLHGLNWILEFSKIRNFVCVEAAGNFHAALAALGSQKIPAPKKPHVIGRTAATYWL